MVVTRKCIPRRTVLRGLGGAVALPLLDAMVPALAAVRHTAAAPRHRLGFVYVPHGAVMDQWTPGPGPALELSPILQPLEAFRRQVVVVSGLDNEPAIALQGEPAGGHGRIGGAFLTGVHVKPTEGADFEAGVSVDQIAADVAGRDTELRSLELSLEATDMAGACDVGFSCAYVNTLCWRSPTTPLPMENSPRAAFERLFGHDRGDPAARRARLRSERSVLDSVRDKVRRLDAELGASDRSKLAEYLGAIRDVERRLQAAEAQSLRARPELDGVAPPAHGIPERFDDYAKLMFDLQVLAYQADLTRVITFMIGKELSGRTYPELGVPDPHHPLSHHRDDPERLAKLVRINVFHAELFAYYLDRLAATADGDGSLLDQVTILYGSGMSNSNAHDPRQLPILVAGGAAAGVTGGRHLRCASPTPLTNLYLSLLGRVGVPVERIGDSTGRLTSLAEV